MADEATIVVSLRIVKFDDDGVRRVIDYQPASKKFTATVTGAKGPSPGSITVDTDGTDVSFSELTTPALCMLTNQDPDNFVTFGIRDPDSGLFYPLGEILPLESYPLRLSRYLEEEYIGTGTGTGTANNKFHFRSNNASCNVLIEAFET